MINEDHSDKWYDIKTLCYKNGPFVEPQFVAGSENFEMLEQIRLLVVGAGGLGCEILKNLALSGFKNIDIIDMDTIELSNLNRQFLFRDRDIDCNITSHTCKIQDKDDEFYRKFHLIICGLDSIDARRWLNNLLFNLIELDEDGKPDLTTAIPLIDGGTEGFRGNGRIFTAYDSPCMECLMDLYPPQITYPLCTIAHTPRLPEHCIEYVKIIQWENEKPFDASIDGDNPDHIMWIYEKALARAEKFGISGVDIRLTQGVVKRIVPAVASTNAIIAASVCLEALKLTTGIASKITNYIQFEQTEGVSMYTLQLDKKDNCTICSESSKLIKLEKEGTLKELIDILIDEFSLKNPSIQTSTGEYLYIINPLRNNLETMSKNNLKRQLKELDIKNGSSLIIADSSLHRALTFTVQLK
ncbi:NEDD8-activating enzyme E1 catalytic subunit [Strongyloides ratti]|uniref:NEDD8-activating enzyme E1 catalytic subunit n=1 Tax=Strongyloides ratti TaxID=34506 RepID=A0A090L9S0_STRRB|nr:NEDD8-activating enzyme E1 catalytic subunit [Strongyloides ratti]CEF66497.1 NEDD8-activating enzyme E1 catalytic subunit [Strongyloides ratti]